MLERESNEMSVVVVPSHAMEFRAFHDDAWYSVCLLLEGESLRIKYFGFSNEDDNLFEPSDFRDLEQLEDFRKRFRPSSKQAQDSECRLLAQGTKVCASYYFTDDDLLFYDAVVEGVQKSVHSWTAKGEQCSCTFILFWIHGPNAGNLTTAKIESICIVQPALELDPAVTSFLEMARRKTLFLPISISVPQGVEGLEIVASCNKSSNTPRRLGYFERMEKQKQRARRSVVNVRLSEVSCHGRRMEDRDLEGENKVCMILIANIDKELCPYTATEFLRKHTSVSTRVFIFPSLPSEVYTRGAIMLDSEREFRKMCDFLNNPNFIITSSTGRRPWVVIEKLVGLQKIKASIGTLMDVSKNITQKRKSGARNNLKIVDSGTKEFKIASDLKDLFLAFSHHQERLHKRLACEERTFAARSS